MLTRWRSCCGWWSWPALCCCWASAFCTCWLPRKRRIIPWATGSTGACPAWEVWQFTQRLAGMVWTVVPGLAPSIAMAVVCSGFRELARDAMIFSAMRAVLWELALVVVSILAIDITVCGAVRPQGLPPQKKQRGTDLSRASCTGIFSSAPCRGAHSGYSEVHQG